MIDSHRKPSARARAEDSQQPTGDKAAALQEATPSSDSMSTGLVWTLWCGFALAATWTRFDHFGSVIRIYQESAQHFLARAPLYEDGSFLYFPTFAALLTPIAALDQAWAGVLIRLCNIALFALGVHAIAGRQVLRSRRLLDLIPLVMILSMAWSAARHGQMTLSMAGLMMLGMQALEAAKHWRAGFLLALALAIKPLALPLVLLALILYPRAIKHCAACALLFGAFPFALQSPEYVLGQYQAVWGMLSSAAQLGAEASMRFHAFSMLKTLDLVVAEDTQSLLRALFALVTVGIGWRLLKSSKGPNAALHLYTLAACYILLFCPGTERNTFALMAPSLGLYMSLALGARRVRLAALWGCLFAAFLLSHSLGKEFPSSILSMAKPLACLVLVLVLSAHALSRRGILESKLAADPRG